MKRKMLVAAALMLCAPALFAQVAKPTTTKQQTQKKETVKANATSTSAKSSSKKVTNTTAEKKVVAKSAEGKATQKNEVVKDKPTVAKPIAKDSVTVAKAAKPAVYKSQQHAKGANEAENKVSNLRSALAAEKSFATKLQSAATKTMMAKTVLEIGGDESLHIDSTFEYDVAVYQESIEYKGKNRIKNSGDYIVVYYSSNKPQFSVQMVNRSTNARRQFFGDFEKRTQLNMTGLYKMASGDKALLDLKTMDPAYPGEINNLTKLSKTGNKKVIAGVACEEYISTSKKLDIKSSSGTHEPVTAHMWMPMDPASVFPAYSSIPDGYKAEMEIMKIEGSFPPVIMPLEMYFEYANGDKVYTYTTDIVLGENRKVDIADINK
ncbi:hypothetical protein LX64_02276 [Chitinophaga skermanii]|uniref:DUF4412 domain-containing protein n=1 Tax=Chitinophaga skermanii TaxID=331697 RepID=A0A327QN95_9BACT|nr:hypothetical protein [Chitinophaga skermanii]RAJ05122.1 hypothetical protein LX64_02276 [Chitinophaga skermanii]